MSELIYFDERKKKRNLAGLKFSRKDIYDFLYRLNIVDLVWDEPDGLSFFLRRTKKESPMEIAVIHFEDHSYGQEFLLINLHEKSYELLVESLSQRLLNYFQIPFHVVYTDSIEESGTSTSCLFVCSECGHTEKDCFYCKKCGYPTDPK